MGVVAEERLRRWREEVPETERNAYNKTCQYIIQDFFDTLSEALIGKNPREPNTPDVTKIVVNYQGEPYPIILDKIEKEMETARRLYSIYKQGVNFLP